jgi:hypothetical protein
LVPFHVLLAVNFKPAENFKFVILYRFEILCRFENLEKYKASPPPNTIGDKKLAILFEYYNHM